MKNFWQDETGQDLIEYTLLLAFVALSSAALFAGAGKKREGHLGIGKHNALGSEFGGQLEMR